ncbi:MAG: hypothetical protein WCO13_12935 [Bacteroidota bacterium]
MTQKPSRDYNCKDEELPVICNFVAFSLNRDKADFMAYSPKFNPAYISGFVSNTASATALADTETEMLEQKTITARLHANMDGLLNPIKRLTGYLALSEPLQGISASDFGLTPLRKSISKRDAEGLVKNIRTVTANITKYKALLVAQGLNDALIAEFASAADTIAADNQQQFEIASQRKGIVQNNIALLNNLNAQLKEILKVGKILYNSSDTAKAREYSFAGLKRNVRVNSNPQPAAEDKKS